MLSIAAAITTATIERHLASGVPVCRAMPNTPSTVHEGIAGLCAGAHADDAHVTLAEEALAHLGAVVRVNESSMDAVTAVSGSGPAYFALLAEAMIEAGLLLGLSREISTQLVVQTMLGTAKQLRDERMHPVELREMVTSPGGTTIAAIRELEIGGRPRGLPERDPGGHEPLPRARRRRALSGRATRTARRSPAAHASGSRAQPPYRDASGASSATSARARSLSTAARTRAGDGGARRRAAPRSTPSSRTRTRSPRSRSGSARRPGVHCLQQAVSVVDGRAPLYLHARAAENPVARATGLVPPRHQGERRPGHVGRRRDRRPGRVPRRARPSRGAAQARHRGDGARGAARASWRRAGSSTSATCSWRCTTVPPAAVSRAKVPPCGRCSKARGTRTCGWTGIRAADDVRWVTASLRDDGPAA